MLGATDAETQAAAIQREILMRMGLGIYHSGIEIQGIEYSYGGNKNVSGSGVFQSAPMTVENARYLCSFNLGTASQQKVSQAISEVSDRFRANEYSMINQNCNHFSEALCKAILGKSIPTFVNRMANIGSWYNFLLPRSFKSMNPIPSGVGS